MRAATLLFFTCVTGTIEAQSTSGALSCSADTIVPGCPSDWFCNDVGYGTCESCTGADGRLPFTSPSVCYSDGLPWAGANDCVALCFPAGTVCTNNCTSNGMDYGLSSQTNDGFCDDGGPGSQFNFCDYGTDCADCSTISTTSGDDGNPCFPNDAIVTKADGTRVRIDTIKEGDSLVAATAEGKITTGTISALSIADIKHEDTWMLTATTRSGLNITTTAWHHLPVGPTCCSDLKTANKIHLGDTVHVSQAGKIVAEVITKMTKVKKTGLHSPGAHAPTPSTAAHACALLHALPPSAYSDLKACLTRSACPTHWARGSPGGGYVPHC